MTFYLKYRPKNLDELDLAQVAESLKKILSSGSIPHAFLFSGPKGTGKTSAARILAKVINCEHPGKDGLPCDECENCKSIANGSNLDVIEMDAASHRGIEDVRVLRDAVKLAPTASKKKIYIIDEAHMLTTEASNALLKTLEEPPSHVIFILATTNPEKLIDTIRSRTTNIAFRKASDEEIINSLKRVAAAEKLNIDAPVLQKIARISGGAFRDAIKILEQFSLEGDAYLNTFNAGSVLAFLELISARKEKEAIGLIEENIKKGISVDFFRKNLMDTLHGALLAETGIGNGKLNGLNKNEIIGLIEVFSKTFNDLADSPIDQLPLEVAVVKWCAAGTVRNEEAGGSEEAKNPVPEKKAEEIKSKPAEPEYIPAPALKMADAANVTSMDEALWKNILLAIKPINASIEGLLRSSKPINYDGHTLTLGVFYKFHKERLEDMRHRKILEDVMAKIINSPIRVVCTLVEPPQKNITETAKTNPVLTEAAAPDIIKAAEEIFGN